MSTYSLNTDLVIKNRSSTSVVKLIDICCFYSCNVAQSYMVQVTLDKDSSDASGTIDLVLYGANKVQQTLSLSKDR